MFNLFLKQFFIYKLVLDSLYSQKFAMTSVKNHQIETLIK